MKVKIGDQVFDSNEQPILLVLSDQDKENIANMDPEVHKFCSFPEDSDESEIREFMKVE
jgi:hypothetical protein